MTTPLEIEIRSRAATVLRKEAGLRDFYRWFVSATWQIDPTDLEARRLSHEILHLFNELSAHILTQSEFMRELNQATSTYVAVDNPWNNDKKTGMKRTTASENDITKEESPLVIVDTPRVAVPA
jgi:hypothetical protein